MPLTTSSRRQVQKSAETVLTIWYGIILRGNDELQLVGKGMSLKFAERERPWAVKNSCVPREVENAVWGGIKFRCFDSCVLCECLCFSRLRKRRIVRIWRFMRHHFFILPPDGDTPFGFFYFRCSGLNDRYLSIFPENGEFSVFTFRDTKTADSPPDSLFAPCRGHENFQSHNRVQRSNLWKWPPFRFGFADKWSSINRLFRTEDTTVLCCDIMTCNKSGRFGFD